jgi:PAS domain S-box-containing protein
MPNKFSKPILIVDDDENIRTSIGEILRKNDYICEFASDASQALKILKEKPFDLVISDIMMPGMDGIQFMQKAKGIFPHLDFIIMTGYASEYAYVDIIDAGAADYMSKPFEMRELLARVFRIERERRILEDFKENNEQLEVAIERANQMTVEAEITKLELGQIFNSTADGMCVIDEDFNMLRMNETLSNILGIENDEVTNKKCYELLGLGLCHGPNCPITRILGGERRVEIDVEKELHDGTRVPCNLTARAFRDLGGKVIGIVVNIRDITDRKKAEEERLHREKFQGVLETAGAVCHELNQPMQAISGYAELLSMNLTEEGPLYEDIEKIREQMVRMGEITNKLMKITKYKTREYIRGKKILDIDEASTKG